jgi:hypothetical protein
VSERIQNILRRYINDDCQLQIASDDILKATTNLSSLKKKPETEDMEIMMTATLSSPAKKGGKKTVKDEKKSLRKYEAYLNSLPDTHEISNEESFKAWVKILS